MRGYAGAAAASGSNICLNAATQFFSVQGDAMRSILLWLIGVPIPIIILIALLF